MAKNLKKLLFLAAFFFVFSLCLAKVVPFTDCGSTATIEKAEILPCEVDFNQGCSLKKLENVTFRITYTPNRNYNRITHRVNGLLTGLRIPFRAIRGPACNNHNTSCPLVQGAKVVYEAVVAILPGFPSLSVKVEYFIESGTEKIVCLNIPTRIINSDGTIPTPRPSRRRG